MACFIDWLKRASAAFQQLTFSKSSVEKFAKRQKIILKKAY